jgi:molybdate transport system substrate-binding protein
MPRLDDPPRPFSLRRAAARGPFVAFVLSAVVLVSLVLLLWIGGSGPSSGSASPLLIYCAGGLKAPLEAIRTDYEREMGQPLQIQYGGSNTLLSNLKITGQGDIFLPADDSYIDLALRDGLVKQTLPVARMRPIVAVQRGNPQQIRSLDDLLSGRVRISMTEPDAAATGKLVRDALTKINRWDAFRERVAVFKPTVNDVANDLKLGAVGAGFIWDAMLVSYPDLEEVPLPELAGSEARVVVAIAAASRQPAAALEFVNYLAAPGKGQLHFQQNGFMIARSDHSAAREQP